METKEKSYPSKIDWWIGMIMVGMPFIHIPLGVWLMTKGHGLFGFLLIFWGMIIAAIIAALNYPCRYILSESSLTIRSGMVTDNIGFSKIKSIEAKRSFTAAPALSLDRVEINLTDDTQRIISPSEQEEFIAKIQAEIDKRA